LLVPDPPSIHQFCDHPQVTRTIEGTLNEFLPSISDNRVLVSLRIEDEHEGLKKFSVNSNIYFLYDFDQKRCKDLLNLTETERASLEIRLRGENEHAQVSIVERNFRAGIEEEVDMEYHPAAQPPQEYLERLQAASQVMESRKFGIDKTPVLEFQEAAVEKKGNPRILFTRSAVWLPENKDIRGIDTRKLALTTSGIVYPPLGGGNGFFFLFECP
jgi:hypothetical protein